MRELRQYFRPVTGKRPILDIRPAENMPDENLKIKPAGNAKAAATLEQGMKQGFVIQNQITRFFVRKQLDETFCRANFLAEHRKNELDVLRRELDAAIGLNHLHSVANTISHRLADL